MKQISIRFSDRHMYKYYASCHRIGLRLVTNMYTYYDLMSQIFAMVTDKHHYNYDALMSQMFED